MRSPELEQCYSLYQKLKNVPKSVHFLAPEVRDLRAALRNACLEALEHDYSEAQAANIEISLWKSAFYTPIKYFRERLANGEHFDKTRAAYLAFLDEADAFYGTLLASLQRALDCTQPSQAEKRQQLRASISCSYNYIGDLRRYAASVDAPVGPSPAAALASAQQAYAAAVAAFPGDGRGFNQLGVLSSLCGDYLAASYYHLRALLAPQRFENALGNLRSILGPALDEARAAEGAAARAARAGAKGRGSGAAKRAARPTSTLQTDIAEKYLVVLAQLFTRIDIDDIPRRSAAAAGDLDELLNRMRQQANSGGAVAASKRAVAAAAAAPASVAAALAAGPPPLLLSLCASLLLVLHGLGDAPKDAATVSLHGYSLSVFLGLISRLAATSAKLRLPEEGPHGAAAMESAVMPPLCVALRWLATQQQGAAGALPVEATTAAAEEGPAAAAGAAKIAVPGLSESRLALWRALAELSGVLRACPAVQFIEKKVTVEGLGSRRSSAVKFVLLVEDCHLVAFPPLQHSGVERSSTVGIGDIGDDESPHAVAGGGTGRVLRMWGDVQQLAGLAQAWLESPAAGEGAEGGGERSELAVEVARFVEAAVGGEENSGGGLEEEDEEGEEESSIEGTADEDSMGASDEDDEDEEEEEEEEILFAPAAASGRASAGNNGGSGLNSAPVSRSTTPQPPLPAGVAAAAAFNAPAAAPAAAIEVLGDERMELDGRGYLPDFLRPEEDGDCDMPPTETAAAVAAAGGTAAVQLSSLNVPAGQLFAPPPPLPGAALLQPPPVAPGQHPAEGLRGLLFGGGRGGGMWGA